MVWFARLKPRANHFCLTKIESLLSFLKWLYWTPMVRIVCVRSLSRPARDRPQWERQVTVFGRRGGPHRYWDWLTWPLSEVLMSPQVSQPIVNPEGGSRWIKNEWIPPYPHRDQVAIPNKLLVKKKYIYKGENRENVGRRRFDKSLGNYENFQSPKHL